jgi:tetratricopeptide (TPR) repeat protein
MSEIAVGRRLLLCGIALCVGALLVRPQISSALVVRGDEMTMRANIPRALEFYRRAIWFDSSNGVAVDRFAFTAMMSHDRQDIGAAVAMTTTNLHRDPENRVLLFDRAMCERILDRQAQAERDFANLGRLARDPQAYTFAGFAAQRMGQSARAQRWWRLALSIRPSFVPAIRALARRA